MNTSIMIAALLAAGIITGVSLAYYPQNDSDDGNLTAADLRSDGSPIRGSPDAPVTILEYGDYQCTFCYRFHQTTLKVLQEKYVDDGQVNVIFRDYILNGADSLLAAEATHCAGDQGKYWEYHDKLYENWGGERTGWVTRSSLSGFAAAAGVDGAEFDDCMDRQVHRQAILDMYKDGQAAGIDATPSFFIFNDEKIIKIRGNQPLEVFEKTIARLTIN